MRTFHRGAKIRNINEALHIFFCMTEKSHNAVLHWTNWSHTGYNVRIIEAFNMTGVIDGENFTEAQGSWSMSRLCWVQDRESWLRISRYRVHSPYLPVCLSPFAQIVFAIIIVRLCSIHIPFHYLYCLYLTVLKLRILWGVHYFNHSGISKKQN